jgi:hypothetical protein
MVGARSYKPISATLSDLRTRINELQLTLRRICMQKPADAWIAVQLISCICIRNRQIP